MSQVSFGTAVVVANALTSACFADSTNGYSIAWLVFASTVSLLPLANKLADYWVGSNDHP